MGVRQSGPSFFTEFTLGETGVATSRLSGCVRAVTVAPSGGRCLMFLLDTDVLSGLRKRERDPKLLAISIELGEWQKGDSIQNHDWAPSAEGVNLIS